MTDSAERPGLSGDRLAAWASVATLVERLPAALDDTAPDRTLRMSTLAGYASSTLSRLSRAISRLEKQGWVRREVDPTDGRFTLAILTDDGHAHVARSTPAHHALVEELVFGSLTEAQVRQLAEISAKIATAIDPTMPWAPSE
jgi:DNA-binding MarR family transcriptional regulator